MMPDDATSMIKSEALNKMLMHPLPAALHQNLLSFVRESELCVNLGIFA